MLGLAGIVLAGPAQAQRTLDEAAQGARYAWLMHDARMLASSSDSLILLRLSGAAEATVRSGQAARLLAEFLENSVERGFDLQAVRETGDQRGYAEAARRYVVRGTADIVNQTIYLGFRRAGGRWRLAEIRVTP